MNRREALGAIGSAFLVDKVFSVNPIETNDGNFRFKSEILRADVPNGNKRIYTRKALENIVKKGVPELGHLGCQNSVVINFSEVSHRVTNPSINENGYLVVDIEVLDTPKGKVLKNMLSIDKDSIVFRTSGVLENYNSRDNGILIIDESFELTSVDAMLKDSAATLN